MANHAPSLRLFLSADLAGSTAFKQNQSAHEWQWFFGEFYRQLPAYVERQFEPDEQRLNLWKTIGDEIVFTAQLRATNEAPRYVQAFRTAVASYRQEVTRKFGGLDLKCAAWTAGFPVGNLIVSLPGSDTQVDYIGPGMDIGFRLVKAASPRRFLLSVELAYILTHEVFADPQIVVGRSLELKGVGKGHRYPALLLDNFESASCSAWDELEKKEEELRQLPCESADKKQVHDYCEKWLEVIGKPFVRPFIDGDEHLGARPDGYNAMADELAAKSQDLKPESEEEQLAAQVGGEAIDDSLANPIMKSVTDDGSGVGN